MSCKQPNRETQVSHLLHGVHGLAEDNRGRSRHKKDAVELPWLAMDLTHTHPWRLVIDRLAFVDGVMRLGGWDMLQDRLSRFLKMASGRQGWLKRADNAISDHDYFPMRHAFRQRVEDLGGHFPYWKSDAGPHLKISVFLRYRQRWANAGITAARLQQIVLAAGDGVLWERDSQIREFNSRAEQARHGHGADIWSVRVEECWAREWPSWAQSIYQGEDAKLSGELDSALFDD